MPLDLAPLTTAPRLLIVAELEPLQGTRFQPTGFPNLGHASYPDPKGEGRMLLVESAQSMANRLEEVCWDEVADDWQPPLHGLPLVKVVDDKGEPLTNSVLEAHRLNSPYIENTEWFQDKLAKSFGFLKKGAKFERTHSCPLNMRKDVYPSLLRYDVSCLLHGVFLESIAGAIRVPRSLSAFIEAQNAEVAVSGGVKNDRVSARKDGDRSASEGFGNVPFAREEWVARSIKAYVNLDLHQIRAFGLGTTVETLLVVLALYKVRRFLDGSLRLRTACDFGLVGEPAVTRPEGFALPPLAELEAALPGLIRAVAAEGLFNDPPILTVTWRK